MEQVLSQEEIDALLKGLSEGEIEEPPEVVVPPVEAATEAKPFDITAYTQGKKERLYALEFVFDRFAKSFRSALTLFIEKEVDVETSPLQYVVYEDFEKSLPLPTNLNVIVTENLKGFFIVIFDTKFIFSVLEILFGSSNITAPRIEGREFTKIELNVIRKVVDLVCVEMVKAWEPVYEIQAKYSRSEMNPNYITMVAKEETVCLCDYTIDIGEVKSWMKLCIPYSILETIKGYLIATPSREDIAMRERWQAHLRERILDVPLQVKAVLGKKHISLQDLLGLKVDSVVMIDRHINDNIDVEIKGKKKMTGKIGTFRGNKAIKVEQFINS